MGLWQTLPLPHCWYFRVILGDSLTLAQPNETLSSLHVPCMGHLYQGKTQAPAPGELLQSGWQGDGHGVPSLARWWNA